jgi:hypothetical protein
MPKAFFVIDRQQSIILTTVADTEFALRLREVLGN